jgi:hypothetical protein
VWRVLLDACSDSVEALCQNPIAKVVIMFQVRKFIYDFVCKNEKNAEKRRKNVFFIKNICAYEIFVVLLHAFSSLMHAYVYARRGSRKEK